LHSLVSPLRAKEYGIPIFRTGSSGISQLVDADGRVMARGSFAGQEEIVGGTLQLPKRGRLPLDHWLAPASVIATVCFATGFCIKQLQVAVRTKKRTPGRTGPSKAIEHIS
jgi:apolipoprotein N-acyltransferase